MSKAEGNDDGGEPVKCRLAERSAEHRKMNHAVLERMRTDTIQGWKTRLLLAPQVHL